MRMVYGTEQPITVLAITLGLTTVVGGAFAILPAEIVDGGLWSMTWVAFLGVMFPVWLLSLGEDSFLADTRLQAALMGLVGLYALQKLRGERHPWFWYPLAGALPGLLLLSAEFLTRFGGGVLTRLVQGGPVRLAVAAGAQRRSSSAMRSSCSPWAARCVWWPVCGPSPAPAQRRTTEGWRGDRQLVVRPSSATDTSRISTLRTLPVTVIGKASTIFTYRGIL